jgi:hypothetical protein
LEPQLPKESISTTLPAVNLRIKSLFFSSQSDSAYLFFCIIKFHSSIDIIPNKAEKQNASRQNRLEEKASIASSKAGNNTLP